MKELFDFIFVRLYYRLFVRPRPTAKAVPEWNIELSRMKATYRGSPQSQEQSPFAGISMTFYLAGDGKGGKTLCGGLGTIPTKAQTALDNMNPRQKKQFLRRLIEEGDRVFRTAWEQSLEKKGKEGKPSPFSFSDMTFFELEKF
ncbi:MAG: hypothetical protein LBF74_02870 [Treponema sp.]|jgi:hypothetical protein|nr:hypothetical protein [Treponema sp.]